MILEVLLFEVLINGAGLGLSSSFKDVIWVFLCVGVWGYSISIFSGAVYYTENFLLIWWKNEGVMLSCES